MRRLSVLILMVLALAGLGAPVARAGSVNQLSIMMDDNRLLYSGDALRDQALSRMHALGVDYVRVTVLWNVVAADARYDRHGRRRKRFRAADPKTYPRFNWDRYDGLVEAAQRFGINVYFNVTGPGPRWAMGRAPRAARKYQRTWNPRPREFFKFVEAVGRRYDGTYRDEDQGRLVLPRVGFWSIYNEPNQPGWLTPQWKGRTPWSPVIYRNLWYYGRAALDATGHKYDTVLIGETAPLGSKNHNPPSQIYPKRFIRELFCLDSRYRPYRGSAAKRRHCSMLSKIGRFRYTAWAHHPYTKKLAPTRRDRNRDSITIANIAELPAVLDLVAARRPGILPAAPFGDLVALTEFGYETRPPDPFSGVSLSRQAAWINEGDYLAYKDPHVVANTQFQMYDVRPVKGYRRSDKRRWFTYQSGLFFANGHPKPSAVAYQFPLVVTGRSGGQTSLWGWARWLPRGAQTGVYLQFEPAGTSQFQTIPTPVPVNPMGFFEVTEPIGSAGTWRAAWQNPYDGEIHVSREIPVS